MAQDQPAGGQGVNLIGQIMSDKTVNDKVIELRQYKGQRHAGVVEQVDLESLDIDPSSFSALLLTNLNGSDSLPEQKVTVEYLRTDQKLVIPAAMGMSLIATDPHLCAGNTTLRNRYLRATTMSYVEIEQLMAGAPRAVDVRAAVDALEPPAEIVRKVDWMQSSWYIQNDGTLADPGYAIIVFGTFSQMLQFNCDIRDFGFLNTEGATMGDGDWQTAPNTPATRLDNKVQPFTLQSIAALNFIPVNSFGLSAWVRAYGVAMGILPNTASKTVVEYMFTVKMPPKESTKAVSDFEQKHYHEIFAVCANIIAMFGLLHLNKDHTYRSNDDNMDRIGTSYINAVRTATNQELIDLMNSNKESIIRTAAHPFGLGQTYCVAQIMHRWELLALPLSIRHDVCPPPVQRILIAEATRKEWGALPAGADLAAAFIDELTIITAEANFVRTQSPRFSGLHALYGIETQVMVSTQAMDAVSSIIPAIVGYIKATHREEGGKSDGLGLAQSIKNVEREMKGLVAVWSNAWDKYLNDVDKDGLGTLIGQLAVTRAQRRENRAQFAAGGAGQGPQAAPDPAQ